MDHLYGKTCPHCGGICSPQNANSFPTDDMKKEAERIARGIYSGTISSGSIDPVMTKLAAGELRKAVIEGFGADFPQLDFDTPHYSMLEQLEKNVFQFSAAKNYQQLKSMSLALRDKDGKIRTFNEFRDEALKISDTFMGAWLQTEYDTAIGSAQMAGKWVDMQTGIDAAPFGRYDTVGDGRVREEHRKLDGVIRRLDDVFWDIWWPPNGWKCRCSVTQLINGKETALDKIELPENVPHIFRTNLAKKGLAFPANHPYFIDIPADVLRDALDLLPYESQFDIVKKYDKGGRVRIHKLAERGGDDFSDVLRVAEDKARKGMAVDVMPVIHPNDPGRATLFKGSKKGKSPDLVIQGKYVEVETPELPLHRNKISHSVAYGSKQADHVIVILDNKVSFNKMLRIANGRFSVHKSLQTIEFKYKNSYYRFDRKKLSRKK